MPAFEAYADTCFKEYGHKVRQCGGRNGRGGWLSSKSLVPKQNPQRARGGAVSKVRPDDESLIQAWYIIVAAVAAAVVMRGILSVENVSYGDGDRHWWWLSRARVRTWEHGSSA